jgi:hypothetical protein
VEFVDKIAAPVLNKIFDYGMIRIIQAIDVVFKSMRKRAGIKVQ